MTDQVRPFSNGSEFREWTDRNCHGCARFTAPPSCELERALALGYIGDGTIPLAIAIRLGCDTTWLGYPATPCPELL